MTRTIAVIGCGLIGRAWTIVFARAGCDLQLWDPIPEVRAALPDLLAETCRISGDDPGALSRFRVLDTLEEALAGAEWVQENGPEQIAVKRDLYARMDRVAAPETILASSSSALVASSFAGDLAGRGRILVAHPVNPPHVVPVVELCPSPDTRPEIMDRAEALMRDVAQVPVRMTREIDGFVLNRLQAVVLAEALSLIEQGIVTPQGLDDTICHGLGRRWTLMGPMATINLNAPGGVADYLERYGPTMARLADGAARGEAFTPGAARILAEAMPGPEQVPSLSRSRDRRLAALSRYLKQSQNKDH
ncbi:3-hydroxyacyl-CoA dehydrogenase [Cereibacter changlensis JA139]|uniref:3-hydroxyacyl-CoA dehydrogenase n=2 Tax=Cereibacter changlensis TaxID=402884 RepID=A0A2T4JZ64_9RHOB|nr:3-hydroxyacyl-CoA dehydrogenase NAD-binding domain-containing protein [Cereibacter changlensis]PTE23212.1 3-hydroxyacyl-CoA dehydrogenase [Cereibacter changlensis JA139]PZX49071.1 3-hydroxyacyl-CoA dehydrogenase [Cereibacter changlensis]